MSSCPICYESVGYDAISATCKHLVCKNCVTLWVKASGSSCPLCRASYDPFILDGIKGSASYAAAVNGEIAAMMQRVEERRQQHREALYASKQRRLAYLRQKLEEHVEHMKTCTDEMCMKRDKRQHSWFQKGHLVPLPMPLSSENWLTISLLTGHRMNPKKRANLLLMMSQREPHWRRVTGFIQAVKAQQNEARLVKEARQATAGSVVKRLGTSLSEALLQLPSGKGSRAIKVFTGYYPPKRGSRVGDMHVTAPAKGICIGFHLWQYDNGVRLHLESGRWHHCKQEQSQSQSQSQ